MRLAITKLDFTIDFHDASEKLFNKLGKKFCEKNALEIAEDLVAFKNIIGDWRRPEAVIIFINGVPWLIPFSELRNVPNDDNILSDAELNCGGLVVLRYIGRDEKLLKAIMKEHAKITSE